MLFGICQSWLRTISAVDILGKSDERLPFSRSGAVSATRRAPAWRTNNGSERRRCRLACPVPRQNSTAANTAAPPKEILDAGAEGAMAVAPNAGNAENRGAAKKMPPGTDPTW
mmetsp:Transcript_39471/g.108746  ORF Transcript_39471/g.108746 Transcript_39471/m.108746 type:complete len:113 (+) Transcript_39471:528-866(+)